MAKINFFKLLKLLYFIFFMAMNHLAYIMLPLIFQQMSPRQWLKRFISSMVKIRKSLNTLKQSTF